MSAETLTEMIVDDPIAFIKVVLQNGGPFLTYYGGAEQHTMQVPQLV